MLCKWSVLDGVYVNGLYVNGLYVNGLIFLCLIILSQVFKLLNRPSAADLLLVKRNLKRMCEHMKCETFKAPKPIKKGVL